ncbi:MAG TPA: hypothetical protein VMU51_35770 [Mycobacteriales bacterium]|nr:hypothetical protein [Mycobacteriales bacterium]
MTSAYGSRLTQTTAGTYSEPGVDSPGASGLRGDLLAGAATTGALIVGILAGTTTSAPVPLEPNVRWMSLATSTGVADLDSGPVTIAAPKPIVVPSDAAIANTATEADQVRWLHEASGLTWDQLGRVFGVSRRAVHLWANGGRMNSINAQTLADLVAVVRELPARSPSDARAQLLAAGPDGRSKLDALRARSGGLDISGTPWSPQQLLDARHDRPAGTP